VDDFWFVVGRRENKKNLNEVGEKVFGEQFKLRLGRKMKKKPCREGCIIILVSTPIITRPP